MLKTTKPTQYSSLSLQELVRLCAGPCDNEAWEEFVLRVGKPISLAVMRTAAMWGSTSRVVIEDLIQATYLKLWDGGKKLLHDFALERPDAIVGYLKRIAANATHDFFKHGQSQSSGGAAEHVSTVDIDPEAGHESHGSAGQIDYRIFLQEIDGHLKHCLTGPDQERDRTIFWLYFRQGMSTKEIASLPGIGLSTKGVGSAIERMKQSLRDQILGNSMATGHVEIEALKANCVVNSF